MSAIGAETALPGRDAPERGVLLLWMIFTGLSIFAVFLLWRYGLIHLMVASDRTYISSVIAVLYLITCAHCFWRTRARGRARGRGRRQETAAPYCRRRMAPRPSPTMRAACRAGWSAITSAAW